MNKHNLQRYGLIAFSTLSFFIGTLLFFQIYIDDAFIFFKYGYNLIHHGIWSWSIVGKPSEAYTSFIYAVLSIFPPLLNVSPAIFIKIMGLLFLLGLLYRLYSGISDKRWALLGIALLLSNWEVYVHAYSGLETILWVWLLLETFFIVKEENISTAKQTRLWIICLLMTLTRPEGAIFAICFFVYLKFYKKQSLNFWSISIVVLIGILYFIARFWYFGLLFPLPFYHKVMDNHFSGILVLIFNIYTSWHYIICAGLILYFFRKQKIIFYAGILFFSIYIALYAKSFLVMNYADRFPFQLFVPFILFAFISLEKSTYFNKVKLVLIMFFLNLIIFSKGIYDNNLIELASIEVNAGSAFYLPRSHYSLAKNINKIKGVEDKHLKVFFGDAGMFPYFVKATCYDYNGLTDAYIAKHPLTDEYFDKISPDVVLIGTPKDKKEDLKEDLTNCRTIYYMAENRKSEYKYLGRAISKKDGYYVHVYCKTTMSYSAELEAALNNGIQESENAIFRIKRFLKLKYLNLDNI
jgi:hypothetical protein